MSKPTKAEAYKAMAEYEEAAEAFIASKKKMAKEPEAYRKAKAKLHDARAKMREARPAIDGVVVGPDTITTSSEVNGAG